LVKYQAYFVGPDGRFTSHRAFACYTDEQAIEWTKQLMDPERPAVLQCGTRVVKRLSPRDVTKPIRSTGGVRDFHDETA
jgi:hypothetical protein